MKSQFNQIFLFFIISIITLTSCSIEKRRYNRGYSIETNLLSLDRIKNKQTEKAANIDKSTSHANTIIQNKIYFNYEVKKVNTNSLTSTSVPTNKYVSRITQKIPNKVNVKVLSDSCDIILQKNGDELQVKIIEIGTKEIKYKLCGNENGPLYVMKKSDIHVIKYKDGTEDLITPDKTDRDPDFIKRPVLGIISLALGIIGIAFLPIVFSSLAMLLGLISLLIKEGKIGFAISGMSIGFLTILLVVILIVMAL